MESLPLTFKRWGYTFTQVTREGDLAIYSQHRKERNVTRYEVVRIREQGTVTWPDGRTTPPKEAYPSSGSWGTSGWTFYTVADAQAKMQSLQTEKESASE